MAKAEANLAEGLLTTQPPSGSVKQSNFLAWQAN